MITNTDLPILHDARLSQFTTFQLGGPCPGLITCQHPAQLKEVIQQFRIKNTPFMLIGGGSNIIVSDEGVDCYVIRYLSEQPLIEKEGDDYVVTASTLLDDLVLFGVRQGLGGINYASGIPGTVGGAIVGNAGAFGKQIGDIVKSISCITPSGETKKIAAQDLGFSYRNSVLKERDELVLSVRLSLIPEDSRQLQKEREEILELRRLKHPDLTVQPCAGSIFRNIEPSSKANQRRAAGWFLEQAGAKELSCGGVRVFEKHANIIVKSSPKATARDVRALSQKMAIAVKTKFDIDLIPEVRFVGKFKK